MCSLTLDMVLVCIDSYMIGCIILGIVITESSVLVKSPGSLQTIKS